MKVASSIRGIFVLGMVMMTVSMAAAPRSIAAPRSRIVAPWSRIAAGPDAIAGVPDPIRIMALGDSITVGVGSTSRRGYRLELAERLAAAGISAEFVGSQQSGAGGDDEGHIGWGVELIADHVDGWLATYRPDVVLLHIGTNDTRSAVAAAAAPGKLSDLIDRIEIDRPTAQIFVAEIISTKIAGRNARTWAYNAAVRVVVASKDDRVHLVDQSAIGGPDLYNTLHPNNVGYAKMAANWYRALEPVIGPVRWSFGGSALTLAAPANWHEVVTSGRCQVCHG